MKAFKEWWLEHRWDRPHYQDAAADAWKAALEWVRDMDGKYTLQRFWLEIEKELNND